MESIHYRACSQSACWPSVVPENLWAAYCLHFAYNFCRIHRTLRYACMAPRKALADQILDLARKGAIPTPFGVEHARKHVPGFSETHLKTVLANYEKNGDMVRRGRRARFERVNEGLYKPA